MPDLVLLELEEKMNKSLDSFIKEMVQVRTGRANPKILDNIVVSYYGCDTPLKQIASITVPEATQLYIKPFDKSTLKNIVSAINASNLGLTPNDDGNGIRLSFPRLTEDRRKELVKFVSKMAEMAKVAIRNLRRDGNDSIKKLKLTEDDEKYYIDEVQKLTDKFIVKVDEALKEKEKELMTV